MKTKLIATLALTLGISMLASCGSVISFPDRATDPDVSLWEEPETEAPSELRDLLGIWHTDGSGTVFRFGENGVLTVWSLTTGYDYEYSTFATGSYTYDGETLTMTLGDEHVSHVCHVKDGQLTFDTGLVLALRTEEPAEHPSYAYPDFEALALQAILPVSGKLTGQTVTLPDYAGMRHLLCVDGAATLSCGGTDYAVAKGGNRESWFLPPHLPPRRRFAANGGSAP